MIRKLLQRILMWTFNRTKTVNGTDPGGERVTLRWHGGWRAQ